MPPRALPPRLKVIQRPPVNGRQPRLQPIRRSAAAKYWTGFAPDGSPALGNCRFSIGDSRLTDSGMHGGWRGIRISIFQLRPLVLRFCREACLDKVPVKGEGGCDTEVP